MAEPPFSPSELRAWKGLLRTHAALTSELGGALQCELGLSISEYEVLLKVCLAPDGTLDMPELNRQAFLTHSGLSRLVTRLERRGLLARGVDDCDRRCVTVTVTPEGRALFAAASQLHAEGVRTHFLGRLTHQEIATLGDVWDRLAE